LIKHNDGFTNKRDDKSVRDSWFKTKLKHYNQFINCGIQN